MNAATDAAAATSSRFGTFALVFGICFAILYVVCEMGAFRCSPITRNRTASIPASRRRAATKGRRCTGMAGSPLLRSAHPSSDFLPPAAEKIRGKIPLALAWVVPVALVPVVIIR